MYIFILSSDNFQFWIYVNCQNKFEIMRLLFTFLLVISTLLAVSQFKCGDQFLDTRDNKSYKTVLIGNQCWFAENLNIGQIINSTKAGYQMTDNGIIEKYCWDNNPVYCDGNDSIAAQGGFYEWKEAVADYSGQQASLPVQGLCPVGWHIPSRDEFVELANYLGGSSVAGEKMKAGGSSGFESDLIGYRCTMSGSFRKSALGTTWSTYFWTSEQSSLENAYFYELSETNNKFEPCAYSPFYKSLGNTIRCVKDLGTSSMIDTPSFNLLNVFIKNNSLNILYETVTTATFVFEIFDTSGKLIMTKKIQSQIGENFYQFDFSTVKSGTYLLKTTSKRHSLSQKIIYTK